MSMLLAPNQLRQMMAQYNIKNAALLNGATGYLNWTPSSVGNQKTWTFSIWAQRGETGVAHSIFNCWDGISAANSYVMFNTTDELQVAFGGGASYANITDAKFRDTTAWYHIVVVIDTTQITASDRIKIYVNNVLQTLGTTSYPAQNYDTLVNSVNAHQIASHHGPGNYFDGYIAETYFIDGQALGGSYFGEIDIKTGNWKAKKVTTNDQVISADRVPVMMGYTLPSGTVTESGTAGSGSEGWRSFDNVFTVGWVSNTTTGWLAYEFISVKTITEYTVTGGTTAVRSPKTWTLEGWTGSAWEIVHTVTDEAIFGVSETRQYIVDTPAPYIKYKIDVTLNHGDGAYLEVYQVELKERENLNYGANGFYLDFADGAELGKDVSGNANHWTKNGTITQVTNTPTDVAATISVLDKHASDTTAPYNGNRSLTGGGYTKVSILKIPKTGKHYWEILVNVTASGVYPRLGIIGTTSTYASNLNLDTDAYCLEVNGQTVNLGVAGSSYTAFAATNIVGFAYDADNDKMWYAVNNTYVNSGDPAVGSNPTWIPTNTKDYLVAFQGAGASDFDVRFEDADWTYTAPTGFKALTTSNLPEVTSNVDDHFKAVLYTGDGVNPHAITGVGFQPDFIWLKQRASIAHSHQLFDSLRGAGAVLKTNNTTGENASARQASFDADGFTLNNNTTVNESGGTYVAWCANLANTVTSGWSGSPSITPSKEIYGDPDFLMSVVAYTGNGLAGATIPHSLGVKPGFMVFKKLDGANDWEVYHKDLGATKVLVLNSTAAAITNINPWNDTEPTSTVISIGGGSNWHNDNGASYIAYIFAPCTHIAIGATSANATTDNYYSNTGLSPVFHMSKRTDSTSNWTMWDDARMPENPGGNVLWADQSYAEGSGWDADFTANGMKMRNTSIAGTHAYLMIGQPNGPTGNTGR